MRRINSILSLALVLVLVMHAVLGSAILVGGAWSPLCKMLIRLGGSILIAHIILSIILVIRDYSWKSPKRYVRPNATFWIRVVTGLIIALGIGQHAGSFGHMQDGVFVPVAFTPALLCGSMVFALCFIVHIALNLRTVQVSLGIPTKASRKYIGIACCALLLVMFFAAFVIYFLKGLS